ncbi:sulfurtransferase TusA family protein [Bailinhaonella thermotolerans]|uniref:Sulfurtransferase TusA family protein n=2 Tax=Bailinhaonella thermotolerans TaxID=1070861 RepID=A0A3A4AT69_9ACTN|nr:sulfurtransferase TusA family protein [Bailinhaonella thermotolerans]
MLAERINEVPLGAVITVLADDPAAYTDIPAWCRLKSHQFVGSLEIKPRGWAFNVRRSY